MAIDPHSLPAPGQASPEALLAALRAPFEPPDCTDVHLNNAGVSPLSPWADAALSAVTAACRRGTLGVGELIGAVEGARAALGRLVGAAPQDVAFFHTCAAALSQVAFGLDLRAGDEIALLDQEYPSNAYPWHRAAEAAGATVVVVPSRPDRSVDVSALEAAIGPRTRILACSWVQYQTGTTLPLAALAERIHARGGLLAVDAIQGLGVHPFDLQALGVDVVCGGSQKWLMGPLGMGFLAARPGLSATLRPLLHGAMTYGTPDDAPDPRRAARDTAKRFEPGAPPIHAAVATGASAEALLAIGLDRVAAEARALSDRLAEGLTGLGYTLRPRGAASPIVTFLPRGDAGALSAALRAAGCSSSPRGGGLRLSPHVHNTPHHIDRALELIDRLDGRSHPGGEP